MIYSLFSSYIYPIHLSHLNTSLILYISIAFSYLNNLWKYHSNTIRNLKAYIRFLNPLIYWFYSICFSENFFQILTHKKSVFKFAIKFSCDLSENNCRWFFQFLSSYYFFWNVFAFRPLIRLSIKVFKYLKSNFLYNLNYFIWRDEYRTATLFLKKTILT